MINIAFLSKWHVHSEEYAKQFQALPYVTIKAVWDEDVTRGKEWANELNCSFEMDLDKLLSRDDIDAVCVGTPTSMHKEVICAAAKAKKAIFTEKVLAITTEDAKEIEKQVKLAEVPFCIALRRRTEARIILAKKMIADSAIGRVTHIRIRDAHSGTSDGWLPNTFYNAEQCGGGAMMDLGAHPMYLSLYFMGEPKSVSSVFTSSAGKGIDDNCVSVLEYATGAIGISETSFLSKNCPFSLEINGTCGHIYMSDNIDGIQISNKDGLRNIFANDIPANLPMPVELFAHALENNETVPFTIEEGVALTKLMDAAYRSYNEKKTVMY
ncbi:MAG: Gfo/Idh/MocA family oxidoreductase [Oscillospiraceae bacterium]